MADAKMLNLDRMAARIRKATEVAYATARAQLKTEAEDLAAAIRRAAPEKTGVLKSTIGARPDGDGLKYTIFAGGGKTTKKVRSRATNGGRGKSRGVSDADFAKALEAGNNTGEFDYSRADEFGRRTHAGVHVNGRPFFFPTYRARKRAMRKRLVDAPKMAVKALFPE
jgi:hypothetical protein